MCRGRLIVCELTCTRRSMCHCTPRHISGVRFLLTGAKEACMFLNPAFIGGFIFSNFLQGFFGVAAAPAPIKFAACNM